MDYKEIPQELLSAIGRLLRQGRVSRTLSLTEAADLVGASVELIDSIENGLSPITTEQAQFIAAKYGGVRGDVIDGMILRLVMEKSRCEQQTQQRKHLSIVGSDPRPWEKLHLSKIAQQL